MNKKTSSTLSPGALTKIQQSIAKPTLDGGSLKEIAKLSINSADVNSALVAISKNLFPLEKLVTSEFGSLAFLSREINKTVASHSFLLDSLASSLHSRQWMKHFDILRVGAFKSPSIFKDSALVASLKLNVNAFECLRMQESMRWASAIPSIPNYLRNTDWLDHLGKSAATFEAFKSSVVPADMPDEIYLATRERFLTSEVVFSKGPEIPSDQASLRSAIIEDIDDTFHELLPDNLRIVSANCSRMLLGAWQAFQSNNIDKSRHTLCSARELINYLLRELATDKEVIEWSTSAEDLTEGKPTRRARLAFIYSAASPGAFKDFIKSDISASLKMIDCLNKIHDPNLEISDIEIKIMLRKIWGLLATLFELRSKRQ